jgi:hypothetical protein
MELQMDIAHILDKQLHTFTTEDIGEIKRLADTIFEPLVRPFRQHRMVEEFSPRRTIQNAMRIGHLMPTYVKRKVEHRKSRLVICMSLSGIDRCSAVSLIPLFGALQQSALDFRLFIYTDTVIKAEITPDGFLANDWKLAWNNVAAPVVFSQILDMPTDDKEDTLLVIDSLGGGDSLWYDNWTFDDREEVRQNQMKYLAQAGPNSWATRIRKQLGGDYSKLATLALPDKWQQLIDRNCKERWMDTPALKEYMVRWLFNKDFGTIKHGDALIPHCNAYDLIARLKGKYRSTHLLTPNLIDGSYLLRAIKARNAFDYHHKTNTVRGFAEVLSNIVHGASVFEGPYTKKISYEKVILGKYSEDADDFEETDKNAVAGDHTELVLDKGDCFGKCPRVDEFLPKVDSIEFTKRVRGTTDLTKETVAFSQLDVSAMIPNYYEYDSFWKSGIITNVTIENGDSDYTKHTKCQRLLDEVRKYQIVSRQGQFVKMARVPDPKRQRQAGILANIEFEQHNTRMLRQDVSDLLEMISPSYYPYLEALPLKHVVWCTQGLFSQFRMAISCQVKEDRGNKRATVWHEALHWLEAVCPPVGAFTNQVLANKCRLVTADLQKLVSVGDGEKAMPVLDGTAAWITPYAGKWYKRLSPKLPNTTEVLTVHGEYFTSKEKLVKLLQHDPLMVRFVAFVLMGGPLAAMENMESLKKREALYQINQHERKSSGYKVRKTGGSGRKKSGGGAYQPKKEHGFGL